LPGFSSLYDGIHGWMTGWMDEKLHEKWPRCPLLYIIKLFVKWSPVPYLFSPFISISSIIICYS
jgi:hypothetical protein